MDEEKIIIPKPLVKNIVPIPVSTPVAPKPVNESHSAIVETLVGDMTGEIENSAEGGLVKKIIEEEEGIEREKKNLSPESNKNKIFTFVGILLLLIAISMVSFLIYKNQSNTAVVVKQFTPLVFSNQSSFLEISGFKKDDIIQAVLNEKDKNIVKDGEVDGIYFTENKQVIGLRRFIALIGAGFVLDSDSSFVSDNFLMGNVKNEGIFLLLKMRSPGDIFNSLRAWEPNMFTNLHDFFGINISSDTNYLLKKDFQDGIIENKNARILYDNNGNIVLMYIFADDGSVIITDSEKAADEIILRLSSGQTQQ